MPRGRKPSFVPPVVGETWSNDLAGRFLEHRRVVRCDHGTVDYVVTFGARTGETRSCRADTFVWWARAKIVVTV